MFKTTDIGIEVSDEDFEFYKHATIGDEKRVLSAIAKFSIMEMDKLGKKRQVSPHYAVFKREDPIPKLYDSLNRTVGDRARKAINLLGALVIKYQFKNDVDRFCLEMDKSFSTWNNNNGHKFKDKEVENGKV